MMIRQVPYRFWGCFLSTQSAFQKQSAFGIGMLGFILLLGLFSPPQGSATTPAAFVEGFAEIVEKVRPAVVNVAVTGGGQAGRQLPPGPFGGPPGPPPGPPGRPPGPPGMSAGSGVVIDSRGYILTNNHVVEDASKITVTMSDGKELQATVVGMDPKTDLAVIKVKTEGEVLPALPWGEYEKLRVGDVVLAVGSPFGLKSSVSFGIISALGRGSVGITEYEDFIQTDAAINPGNSGGALVNMNGELIGVNTAIFSRTGGSEGVGFAIAVSIAKDIASSLIESGKVVRGWMGVAIQELTPALAQSFQLPANHTGGGVLISEVHEQGPSAKAGIQRGDVILQYAGEPVKDVNHLRNIVARTRVGEKVEITVLRDGKKKGLILELGERPSDEFLAKGGKAGVPPPSMEPPDNVLAGIAVEPLSAEKRKQLKLTEQVKGVVVARVQPGSAAEAAGVQEGDLIQEVSREVITNVDDYQRIASKIAKEELVVLLLNRRGNNLFVAVNPG